MKQYSGWLPKKTCADANVMTEYLQKSPNISFPSIMSLPENTASCFNQSNSISCENKTCKDI